MREKTVFLLSFSLKNLKIGEKITKEDFSLSFIEVFFIIILVIRRKSNFASGKILSSDEFKNSKKILLN